jgi:diaminopimelate epimerase
MEQIKFFKMSGSGNDFIIIDNRAKVVDDKELTNFISNVCRRKMSVGADGVILLENAEKVDFKWRFFNSDGSTAEMCGNGARCVARFAFLNKITGPEMSFETDAGIVHAQITEDGAKIKTTDPSDLKIDYKIKLENRAFTISSINTGVPHVVIEVDELEDVPVNKIGREIRFHEMFAPAGTNVNFIHRGKDDIIAIRTYERGVENETLACGTGAIASAIVMADKAAVESPVKMMTRSGGFLYVYYEEKQGRYYNVYLDGDARLIYQAQLSEDAWKE